MKYDAVKKETSNLVVGIQTCESELELKINCAIFGESLLHLVCQTVGVCETWYFGLLYENNEGLYVWLKNNESLYKQKNHINFKKPFLFVIKYFPENISELTFSRTVHLFFLQMKQSILNMNILCPAEVCVLLASYALQADYGDFKSLSRKLNICLTKLVPENVIKNYNMTCKMWEDLITYWYSKHHLMKSTMAKVEYLKIVETLQMYGIHYFLVFSGENDEDDCWVGLSNRGINIYRKLDMADPVYSLQFGDVKEIICKNTDIKIKIYSGKEIWLTAEETVVSQIKELYEGNHKLFTRRLKLQKSLGDQMCNKNSAGMKFSERTSDSENVSLSHHTTQKDWRYIENVNQLLNERYNAVEEEAIMLCGIITKLMLQQSRDVIRSCLSQIL